MVQTHSTTISVVVTDIVGSTAQAERLGSARFDEVRRRHFATLRAAVAATGGTEVKNLGDGLMVVYGSARDALDGAIAIQQAVDASARQYPDPVSIRVGVATGDATAEDDDYFGMPVVEASRLCAAARGGQILTTATVRLLTDRTLHRLSSVGEFVLKGLAEPVEAWELSWEVAAAAHDVPLPSRLARPLRYGFVGRRKERDALGAHWRAAVEGERRFVFIVGEPGIGKSSLAGEIARSAAAEGALVLYGRCDEEIRGPYRPFMEAFEHLVAHAPAAMLADHVRRHRGDLLGHVGGTSARFGDLPPTAAGDAASERDSLFAATVDLLRGASAQAPIVLVLDDLHWADRQTVLLLRHLVLAADGARILVVGTAREDEMPSAPMGELGPSMLREPGVDRISLRSLGADDTLDLVESAAGYNIDDSAAIVAEAVYRESGGNPFFVVQLLRDLTESGHLVRDESGAWVATEEVFVLPDSVRDVVAHRLARLGEETVKVLAAASVLGTDIDLRLVERVTGVGSDEVLDIFERASAALLLQDAPDRPGWFTFSHAIVQHTLYLGLSASRRVRLHQVAAETLEEWGDGSRVAECARHWVAAALAAGPDVRARAARAAEAAGDDALDRLGPEEACDWYGRAVELDGDAPAPHAQGAMLVKLGTAQRFAGLPEFRTTLLRAAHIGHAIGEADILIDAALANNRGIQSTTGTVDAERVEVLRWALDAAAPDDAERRSQLLALLALEQLYTAPYEERLELVVAAMSMARDATRATLLRVLNLSHNAIKSPRSLPTRLESTSKALALSAEIGDPADRYWALDQRIRTLGEVGDLATVDELLDESEAIARTLRRPVMLYLTSMHRTWRAILGGDLDKAESWAEATRAVGRESGQPEADAMFGSYLLRIRRDQGRGDELVEFLEAIAAANPNIGALQATVASLHAVVGNLDRAGEMLDAQRAVGFDSIHHDNLWSSALAEWADVAAAVGNRDAARELFDLLAPYSGVVIHNGATSAGPLDRILALLLATMGRREEALEKSAAAERQSREAGMSLFLAHSLVDRAELLAATGDGATARRLALEAAEIASATGAGLIDARARRVLDTLGGS